MVTSTISSPLTAHEVYERLSVEDVRMAANVLRGVYDHTPGADGFVTIEVSGQPNASYADDAAKHSSNDSTGKEH